MDYLSIYRYEVNIHMYVWMDAYRICMYLYVRACVCECACACMGVCLHARVHMLVHVSK